MMSRNVRYGYRLGGRARAGLAAAVLLSGFTVVVVAVATPPAGASGPVLPSPAWAHLSPATSPPARYGAASSYDSAMGSMLLFGGNGSSTQLGDTWTFDGSTWAQLSPGTSPSAREYASMTYSPAQGRAILFGGYNGARLSDTWTFDGSTWAQLPVTGPPARENAAMAYDPATGYTVLFGGIAADGSPLNDTWLLTEDAATSTWTWSQPINSGCTSSCTSSPAARSGASMAYDPATGNMVLFGGLNGGSDLNDTWTWIQVVTAPGSPQSLTAKGANSGSVALSWSPPSSYGGSPVTYNVYDSTTPGGEGNTPVNSPAITGTAYDVTGLVAGTTYYFVLKASNSAGTSSASNETSSIPYTLAASSSPPSPVYPANVTVSVNGLPANATGSVSFTVDSTVVCTSVPVSGGGASCAGPSPPAGSHSFTAAYSGDGNYVGSSVAGNFSVAQAATSLTLAANPTTTSYGNAVDLSASNLPAGATGTVAFSVDGTVVCAAVPVSGGGASCTDAEPATGVGNAGASYSGDTDYQASNAAANFTVTQAPVTFSVSTAPLSPVYGDAITITASGLPSGATGTINFSVDGTVVCGSVTVSAGGAACVDAKPVAGSHGIKVAYSGDSNYQGENATANFSVSKAPTTFQLAADPSTSIFGTPVTLAVTDLPADATGTVTFSVDGVAICSAVTVTSGGASCTDADPVAGSHIAAAAYSGDGNYQGSNASGSFAVVPESPPAPEPPSVSGLSPTSGASSGGTMVTIYGSGFTGATAVNFGTVAAASFNVVSADEITALSPSENASVVDVIITTTQGTSTKSSADRFSYFVPSTYEALAPGRVCDTRAASGIGGGDVVTGAAGQCANSGHAVTPFAALDVQVVGLAGVPASGVSAVVVNVTAIDPAGNGYVTVFPAGSPLPDSSNLNFSKGEIVANLVEVGVGANGYIAIESNTSLDVVVDVDSYYVSSSSPSSSLYSALSAPQRICDTRPGNPSGLSGAAMQCDGSTLQPGASLPVQVTGVGGVPTSGVSAVMLNVTATGFSSSGYLEVYPFGVSRPTASNLNFLPRETAVPAAVVVPVSSSGKIELVSNASTDAVVDVTGYFGPFSTGSMYDAEASPARICDTRSGNPSGLAGPEAQCNGHTMTPGGTMTVQVTGLGGVPTGAQAVVLNVTVTGTDRSGYLSIYPGANRPTVSSLNWNAGQTVPNMVTATLGQTGTVTLYNSSGSTNVIVDVEGWYP